MRRFVLAILGVGNDLRGDDGAGVAFLHTLSLRCGETNPNWLLLEACAAPENFTGVLRRFEPDVVCMVDAVHMRIEPGSIAVLDIDQIDGFSASTHMMPLSLMSEYLHRELGCTVQILGIQVKQVDWNAPLDDQEKTLSPEVQAGVDQLVEVFYSIYQEMLP